MRMKLGPQAIALPEPEVVIDRGPGSKILRQVAPLAGGLDEIEHRVEQLPLAVLPGATRPAGAGKTVIDELPFGIGQVRGVSHPQCTAGMYLQCTDKWAILLRFS